MTALAVRPGRSDRTRLSLDGQAAGDLATAVVDAAALRIGMFLSEEAYAALLDQDEPHRARARALRLLAARDRSGKELAARLQRAGFGPAAVAGTITWLEGLGYVDDECFALRYAADKIREGWAERRVRSELQRKGVDRQWIDASLAALDTPDEETSAASYANLIALVQRRFGSGLRDDREGTKRRVAGFLARRGYDWEMVARVLRDLDMGPKRPDGREVF